jgi:hypothetical protein
MRNDRPTACAARRKVSSVTEGTFGSRSRSSWRLFVFIRAAISTFGQALLFYRGGKLHGNEFLDRVILRSFQ